jgi:hypothetical protein
MRTKYFVVLSVFIFFLGCESGPKKIKFDELSSKTFRLYRVFYMTMVAESYNNASDLFVSLPIQDIVQELETRYGVNIDASLFSNIENNVSQIKSYNLGARNYFLEYEIDDPQRVSISISRIDQEELTVEIRFTIFENGNITFRNDYIFAKEFIK